jgi:hypothetical protein
MRFACKSSLAALLFVLAACSTTGGGSSDRIEITAAPDDYRLSVPVSNVTMILPKGNWSRKEKNAGGGTSNPRYFYFEDSREASLILSGWFEPDRRFEGVTKHWEKETQAWKKRGLPEPVNVSFEKLGRWDAVIYDHNFGKITNTHLRAHLVQSGTWIDLHLSTTTTGTSADNRKKLRALLRGISILEKTRA